MKWNEWLIFSKWHISFMMHDCNRGCLKPAVFGSAKKGTRREERKGKKEMAIFWSEYTERARNPYSFSCLSAGLYISQAGGTKIFKYHADPGNARQYLKSSARRPRSQYTLRRRVPRHRGGQYPSSFRESSSRPGFR